MLAFALVSELPFDLAFFHTLIYQGHQNVYWTLFFGLCALGCLRHCGERSAPGIFSALALAVLAELLRTDYGAIGVLLIVVLYITRASRPLQCLCLLYTSKQSPATSQYLFGHFQSNSP